MWWTRAAEVGNEEAQVHLDKSTQSIAPFKIVPCSGREVESKVVRVVEHVDPRAGSRRDVINRQGLRAIMCNRFFHECLSYVLLPLLDALLTASALSPASAA